MYGTLQEAMAALRGDLPRFEQLGVSFMPGAEPAGYVPEPFRRDYTLALDAQPSLTTTANAGIPAFLTTLIDPAVYEILFAPNKIAIIYGEVRKGTWLDQTVMFPTVEHTGEVSSYGDWNENGVAGVNMNWPQRQAYLYQVVKEYGELQLERAGLGRINWVSEVDKAAATVMNKFQNLTYAFGVAGLQNYGLLNDPSLSASLTPGVKAAGGTKWTSGTAVVATANEIYLDIEAMFLQLVNQTAGLVDRETPMVLALSPISEGALTATNSFNVNVSDLLKKNFPNLKVESAIQYGALSSTNPQGVAAGNFAQLIVRTLEGQDTGYCSFNEKMRAHPIIRAMSSFRQKQTGGTWGAVVRMPVAISSMVGL